MRIEQIFNWSCISLQTNQSVLYGIITSSDSDNVRADLSPRMYTLSVIIHSDMNLKYEKPACKL